MHDGSSGDLYPVQSQGAAALSVSGLGALALDGNADGTQQQVVYFSNEGTPPPDEVMAHPNQQVSLTFCHSLEDLFSMLGEDLVDVLVFCDSLAPPERQYILRWARIFKPGVRCESASQFASLQQHSSLAAPRAQQT